MRFQKTTLLALLGAYLAVGPSWSDVNSQSTQAHFASIQGKVTVLGSDRSTERKARLNSKIREGERVITGKESSATLVMFDGSELKVSAKTAITLSKLQRPSPENKILEFKLLVGHILAKVKKLTSSSSSFEVDAGGVVCGVRGTVFAVQYVPSTHSLFVNVVEGSVYTQMGQKEITLAAGQRAHFSHVPTSMPNGQGGGNQGPNNNGKKGTGSNTNGQSNGGQNGNGSTGNSTGAGNSDQGSTGQNGNSSTSSTGSSDQNSGQNSGGSANNPGGTDNTNPGTTGSTSTIGTTSALGDLNNQFLGGVLINGENNLTQAEQTINIHLVVPPGEAVP